MWRELGFRRCSFAFKSRDFRTHIAMADDARAMDGTTDGGARCGVFLRAFHAAVASCAVPPTAQVGRGRFVDAWRDSFPWTARRRARRARGRRGGFDGRD